MWARAGAQGVDCGAFRAARAAARVGAASRPAAERLLNRVAAGRVGAGLQSLPASLRRRISPARRRLARLAMFGGWLLAPRAAALGLARRRRGSPMQFGLQPARPERGGPPGRRGPQCGVRAALAPTPRRRASSRAELRRATVVVVQFVDGTLTVRAQPPVEGPARDLRLARRCRTAAAARCTRGTVLPTSSSSRAACSSPPRAPSRRRGARRVAVAERGDRAGDGGHVRRLGARRRRRAGARRDRPPERRRCFAVATRSGSLGGADAQLGSLAFAAVVTLASAVVILALQASAAFCGRCWAWCADGDAARRAAMRRAAAAAAGAAIAAARRRRAAAPAPHSLRSEVGAQLGSQRRRLLPTALQAATSIVWSYALRSLIVSGLPKDERGGGRVRADARALGGDAHRRPRARVDQPSRAAAGSARGGADATPRWRRRSSASSS